MRIFRTKEDWKEILKEQKESGKTATEYCKEKHIHPNLFYKRRKELETCRSFIKVPVKAVSSGKIRIKIKDIIIELEPGYNKEELISVIITVLEAINVNV